MFSTSRDEQAETSWMSTVPSHPLSDGMRLKEEGQTDCWGYSSDKILNVFAVKALEIAYFFQAVPSFPPLSCEWMLRCLYASEAREKQSFFVNIQKGKQGRERCEAWEIKHAIRETTPHPSPESLEKSCACQRSYRGVRLGHKTWCTCIKVYTICF